MPADRNVYGAATGAPARVGLRALVGVPWIGVRGIVWRWRVLVFVGLNLVAVTPMFWIEQDDVPFPTMAGMLGVFPVVAYLQPWTGVFSLLKAMRAVQLVILPLLGLLGLLTLPMALALVPDAPNWPRAVAGLAAMLASAVSLRGQIRLWRWQATMLAERDATSTS